MRKDGNHINFCDAIFFFLPQYKEVRTVRQFQFTTWPDMGVPADPKTIIGFVRTVRAQQVADAGPMTIHCRCERH